MDQNQLVELLKASQTPNTEQVKAATAQLQKNYYSKPESLLLLIEIAITGDDTGLRQLACVQGARQVTKHWEKLPQDKRTLARNHLVDAALKEQSPAIRHSMARLVAVIVGADMELQEGDDFLKQLVQLNTSDSVVAREVGSYILYAILEEDPTSFSDHTHQLLQLFQQRIDDGESKEVRLNIVRAIGAILLIIEPEEDQQAVQAMQGFIPSMVNILKDTIQAEDEDSYKVVFEVFQSFIGYDSALLGGHLRDLLDLMMGIAANSAVEEDARSQALAFLIQCVRYRRMKIQAMKDMGAQLMVKAMHIITELDDEDDEDLSPARTAISLVDTLASELPPRQVVVPLLENFPAFATNSNPQFRVAAMLALGNAAEGAPDFISTQIKEFLPTIVQLLCDNEKQVRHASLVGLIHIAEEMADEMTSHQEELIGAVLKNLEDASQGPATDKKNISIIRCACGALDTLGDGLDTQVMASYGPNLLSPMVRLLQHEDFTVKAAAASAIGAIASSMEEGFQPYFGDIMKSLAPYVTISESEDAMELRSATCDTLGRIALAVGAETFQPYVMDLMKASEQALSLDNPRLKETSFILWSNLSKVYKDQFEHFLEGAFKGLFASLELEDEEINMPGIDVSQLAEGSVVVGGKRIKVKSPDSQEDLTIATDGDEEEDWDDLDDLDDLGAVTAIALEQEIALDVLGDVISNSCNQQHLETFVEKAIETVVPFAEHTYEGCRKTAISTLWRTYARVFQVWKESSGAQWQQGLPATPAPPASIDSIGQTLRKATMSTWSEDTERSVITDINRNIAATLKACGPAVLKDGMVEEIVTVVGLLLTRSHPCQQDLGDEEKEEEVEGGTSEYDWLAVDTAIDVVVGLSAALGGQFAELWKILEKPVLKIASSSEDLHRSTAVGGVAEIIKYTGEAITPFTDSLGQALVHRLGDEDSLAKSNAAYALGLLIQNSAETDKTLPMYGRLWEKLEPLLSVNESRMTDNVAGCVSRMMIRNPDGGFVAQALPAVVSILPLTEDYEENAPIYENIYKLWKASNPTVQQLGGQLRPIFQKVLSPPEEQLEPETRQAVQEMAQ